MVEVKDESNLNMLRQYAALESIYNLTNKIAMEAPAVDVREITAQQMNDLENNGDPDGEGIDNRGRMDDFDIGDNGNDDSPPEEGGTNPADNLDNGEDEPTDEEGTENPADNLDGGDTSGETGEEDTTADDTGEETTTPFETELDYRKRQLLHENTIRFLNVVESGRESFDQRFNHTLSIDQLKEFHRIIKTFDSLIDITKDILKTKFMKSDYQTLEKYNVTLNRVYDIIRRMVKNFVDQYCEENETKK